MDKTCVVYKTADLVAKKWTLLLLLELYKGAGKWKRYSYLKNNIHGITSKILSARLKELEAEGIIAKRFHINSVPLKSEYALTDSGTDIMRIIKELKHWTLKWKVNDAVCERIDCINCKK